MCSHFLTEPGLNHLCDAWSEEVLKLVGRVQTIYIRTYWWIPDLYVKHLCALFVNEAQCVQKVTVVKIWLWLQDGGARLYSKRVHKWLCINHTVAGNKLLRWLKSQFVVGFRPAGKPLFAISSCSRVSAVNLEFKSPMVRTTKRKPKQCYIIILKGGFGTSKKINQQIKIKWKKKGIPVTVVGVGQTAGEARSLKCVEWVWHLHWDRHQSKSISFDRMISRHDLSY